MIDPRYPHFEILQPDQLPHLIERRQAVYAATKCDVDAIELARLWSMWMWLTEEIVYIKTKFKLAT